MTGNDPLGPRLLLRGYGPLALFALLFVLMAGLVPSVDQTTEAALTGPASVARGDAPGSPRSPAGAGPGAAAADPGSGGPATSAVRSGGPARVVSSPGRGRGSCGGRARQVTGDPYSPPCVEWEGDNGGATSRGVTSDSIVVSARILDEKGFQQTLAQLAGAQIADEPKDIERTIGALAEFFNQRYQFYGRRLKVAFFNGAGNSMTELQGGGQAEAEADAEQVSRSVGAFAELNGGTEPFGDALARRGVVSFGTPYLSREWYIDRRPYTWSPYTDCSLVAEMGAELSEKQLLAKPARWAGGKLRDTTRSFTVLAPENPWYQQCVDAARRIHQSYGHDENRIVYKLDINSMSQQAAGVIAKLKSESVTTVAVPTDPIFPVFLTAKAAEQDYWPEWIVEGTAFTDTNVVGQLYNQKSWSHAFGISFQGAPVPLRAGLGYAAYKSIRGDEPAFAVELIYSTMLMLAIGIQEAGPGLTPQTFEQGMFAYPGGTGPYGTWHFGARSYTPTQDYRVIWWNPDAVAVDDGQRGSWVEGYGGRRFLPGSLPREDPPVFTSGPGPQ